MLHSNQIIAPRAGVIPAIEVLPSDRGLVVRQNGATVGLFGHDERSKADALVRRLGGAL